MPALIAPIIGFFTAIISRFMVWFITLAITGALKTIAIYVAFFALAATAITTFLFWVNDQLTTIVNGLHPITQGLVSSFLAFFPANLPYYVGIILSYYTTSWAFHMANEIRKYRQRAAIEATKSFYA